MRKNLATKELKQIWNSAVAVDIAVAIIVVATIAVAILEQRQRKFCAGYLQIIRKMGEPSPKEKNTKKQKKNKIQERD